MDNFFYFNIRCAEARLEYFKQWVESNYKNNYSHLFYQAIVSHNKVLRNNLEIIKYFIQEFDFNPNEYIKFFRNGVVYGCYCPVVESALKGDLEIVQYFLSLEPPRPGQSKSIEVLYSAILYASASTNKIDIFEYIVNEFLTAGAGSVPPKGCNQRFRRPVGAVSAAPRERCVEDKIEQLKKIIVKLYECKYSFEFDQRMYIEETRGEAAPVPEGDERILLLPRREGLELVNYKLGEYRKLLGILKKELNEQYTYSVKKIANQNDMGFAEHLIMSYLMV